MIAITKTLGPFVLACALASCTEAVVGPICLDYAIAGINVKVRDSVTGAWAASGALLIISGANDFVESIAAPPGRPDIDSLPIGGAYEKAGTFNLLVRKAGYSDWARAGVRVSADACHVRPVQITAQLKP